MSKYIKYFLGLTYCPVCGAKGENIKAKYIESFNDDYMEECELYDCKCLKCGFIFQDFI